ncbi:MAG: insulinase family protein, partial [Bacteroidota bacterium]
SNLKEGHTYLQKVQAVTIADIKATAQKYLKPKNAYINVVGKASEVAESLKQFGELTYYDTYGNEVDPSLAKLPEGLTAEKVFMNYIDAIGGKEKLTEVNAVMMKMQASVMGQTMDMEQTKASPNKSLIEVKMGGNVVQKIVFDGEKGKMSGMQGNQDITGDKAMDMKISSAIVEELAYLDSKIEAKLSSLEKIDGKDAYGVEVKSPSGTTSIRYYDAESGLLVRASSTVEGPQGAMTLSSDFNDYKEFEGILFPTKLTQPLNAQVKMQISVSDVVVNPDVDASTFKVE